MSIKTKILSKIGKTKFIFKKNGTTFIYFASIGLILSGTALLIKESINMEQTLDRAEAKYLMKKKQENPNLNEEDIPIDPKELKKTQRTEIFKRVAGPIALYGLGTALNIFTFKKQRDTIKGLGLALNGVTAAYNGVLAKIRKEQGEEAYLHYKYNMSKKEFLNKDEHGNVTTEIKEKLPDKWDQFGDPFTFIFDERCSAWNRYSPAENYSTLVSLYETLKVKLTCDGYISAWEIPSRLGWIPSNKREMELVKIWRNVGWRAPFKDEKMKAWDEGRLILPTTINFDMGIENIKKMVESPYELTHMKAYPILLGSEHIFDDPRLWENVAGRKTLNDCRYHLG